MINCWFSKNTGLMLGIQMAFVGLFGMALQPLTSIIIAARGWRYGYYLIGGGTFVVVLLSALLLRNKPADIGQEPYGANDQVEAGRALKQPDDTVEVSEKTAVRSASFYLLLLFMVAVTGVAVFTQHIPTYGALLGYTIQQSGFALAFASLGNAIGSVVIGIISDRIGSLKTCYGIMGVGLLAVAVFL